jgi:glycosyltransferase involved in cell wall biosynthesis
MLPNPRITIIGLHYPPESTGNAPYTGALATGLSNIDMSVRVIAGHPHYPQGVIRDGYGQWVLRDIVDGVPVTRLRHLVVRNSNSMFRLLSEVSFGVRVLFASWQNPDVVVLVSPALFSTAIAMVRARLTPSRPQVVVWVQDLYSLGVTEVGSGGTLLSAAVAWVESRTLKAASRVIVIHARFATYVTGVLHVESSRIEVVRNWTHLQPFIAPETSGVRKLYGWAQSETIVLHAGNMGAKQGLHNVVAAARLADEQKQPVRFVLIGDGNQRAEIERQAIGIQRIQFIDPLVDQDFQSALSAADVLLINEKPGVSEMSVPSKLTSYFNTGLAVVAATDPAGVTAGEIRAAKGGLVVAAGDPEALLAACLQLRDDPSAARELGRNGQRYRREFLGQEAAIGQFAAMLRSLAAIRFR